MSTKRIAEILHVDEVKLSHGPDGVLISTRVDDLWKHMAIDHEDLGTGKHRLEVLVKHLVIAADESIKQDNIRKGLPPFAFDGATRAAVRADQEANQRRWVERAEAAVQQANERFERRTQVTGVDQFASMTSLAALPERNEVPETQERVAIDQLPSRFHAIMAELEDL